MLRSPLLLVSKVPHYNRHYTMDLKKVCRKFVFVFPGLNCVQVVCQLEALAPTSLAESWDNVGLLMQV